jgi:hypothetical protein
MINPFVYDRFMSGQYGVLLGYAFLPWFARSLYGFVRKPDWASALRLSGWLVALSIVSIHSVGLAVLLMVVVVMYVRGKRQLGYVLAALGIFVMLSSYWLVPTMLGQGRIAESLPTFTSSERQAFATVDAVGTGPLGAVLGMQGFWQETRGLYVQPIEANAVWGFVQLFFFALVVAGIVAAWRAQRQLAICGIVVGIVSASQAVGLGSDWLASHVPFFAGYREPQKFVALLADRFRVVLLPMLVSGSDAYDDMWASQQVQLRLPDCKVPTRIYRPKDLEDMVQMLGSFDLIIGTRLHVNILGTFNATPCLGIAYRAKVSSFFSDNQLGDYCIDLDSLGLLPKVFMNMYRHYDVVAQQFYDVSKYNLARSESYREFAAEYE